MVKALYFLSILLTTLALGGGLAHLYALPNKIGMAADDYLAAQQAYRGWFLLGIPIIGGLLSTAALAASLRGSRPAFHLVTAAAVLIVLSLAVFFAFTYPTNQQTRNWTMLPSGWEQLRSQWEYSHAVGALLNVGALSLLTLALLSERR